MFWVIFLSSYLIDIHLWDSSVFYAGNTVLQSWRGFLLHRPCFNGGISGSGAHLAAGPGCSPPVHCSTDIGICP